MIATQAEVVVLNSSIESNRVEYVCEIEFVPHKMLGAIAERVCRKAKDKARQLRGHPGRNIVIIDVRTAYHDLELTIDRLRRGFDKGRFQDISAIALMITGLEKESETKGQPALVTVANPREGDFPTERYESLEPEIYANKRGGLYLPGFSIQDSEPFEWRKKGTTFEVEDVTIENPLQSQWMLMGFIGEKDSSVELDIEGPK